MRYFHINVRGGINGRKLRYFGHNINRRDVSVEKLILQGSVEGSRGRGRPITSWTDDIKRITGLSMAEATQMTAKRTEWRTLVRTTEAPTCAI